MPAHLRATTDMTEFYEKPPQEMSRYELADLEKFLRDKEIEEQLRMEKGSDYESEDELDGTDMQELM